MKSILKVLSNILLFGVPIFIKVLSKSRKFDAILQEKVEVTVSQDTKTVILRVEEVAITLDIDRIHKTKVYTSKEENKDDKDFTKIGG